MEVTLFIRIGLNCPPKLHYVYEQYDIYAPEPLSPLSLFSYFVLHPFFSFMERT